MNEEIRNKVVCDAEKIIHVCKDKNRLIPATHLLNDLEHQAPEEFWLFSKSLIQIRRSADGMTDGYVQTLRSFPTVMQT